MSARGETRSALTQLSFVLILFCILLNRGTTASCVIGGYNLDELDKYKPWETDNDFTNLTYTISICSTLAKDNLDGCEDGTSVCGRYSNGTAINYGSFSTEKIASTGSEDGELMLMYRGESCPDYKGEQYSSVFYFKCGKTLGHPYHIGDLGCSTHFEWESYLFCKDSFTPEKEVRCTVMKDGHLIDLSPLTKLTGGYHVDQVTPVENRHVIINVCRDIKPEQGTDSVIKNCPKGAAACRVLDSKGYNFGEPSHRIEASSSGVKLVYESSLTMDGCAGKPKVTINFVCPQRGGSKSPSLISDFLCDYEIEWVTEYACPVDHITSKTCKLTSAQHDVDIDLTPLKQDQISDHPYLVNATDGDDHYRYYINICDTLGYPCGKSSTVLSSACQRKDGSETSFNLGEMRHARLTYSDGDLVMHYRNGDICSDHLRRSTFINFQCNKSAVNDGKGYPEYVGETHCTYTFNWGTKYACIDRPVCRVEGNGKQYDLSSLVKQQGENWAVLISANNEAEAFYLNICHDVLRQHQTSACPAGSAICSLDEDGNGKNLGKFTQNLQYDEASNSLKLTYTDGDKTESGCMRKTTVNLFCLPGVLDSPPRLVHQSEDGCYHEVEWHTAAACPLSHKRGKGCNVYDDTSNGYNFDLSVLKKDDDFYKVTTQEYTYYINVCNALKGKSPCDKPPHDNAAICQVSNSDESQVKRIGDPDDILEYYDGVLNMTFTNGEAYHNAEKSKRVGEIAFLCDMNAGVGSPEFLVEKDYTYAFEWKTMYACPSTPVECLVTDSATGKQYDLSSLSKSQENWEVVDSKDPDNKKKYYLNVCRPVSAVKGEHCSPFASVCVTNIDKDGKETLLHGNLGRAETSPEIEKATSGLKLTYTNGNDCEDNGIKKKFTTTLHLICVPGDVTAGPLNPKLVKPCEYALIWETAAACAINHVDTGKTGDKDTADNKTDGGCSIKDPNSDFTFNLMPLYKKNSFYEVKTGDGKKTYKLNICGPVADDTCGKFSDNEASSVCDGSSSVASMIKRLTYSSTGDLTLTYNGKNDLRTGEEHRYTFSFMCDRAAQEPKVEFGRGEKFNTNFRVYTALACPPQPVECKAVDSLGQEYDLSLLAREFKNWVVVDTRPNHGNLHYHINVCRPVVTTAEMSCPGGAVGGCQTGDKSYNMGYVQSNPVAANDGSAVTIVYQGGDRCHVDKETESMRSTRITFVCDGVEHGPVFESESESCEYRFIWRTPSACPQRTVTGSGCRVKEPLYDHEFDLNVLRKTDGNYKVTGDGYDFYLNVCGPLVAGSHLCSEANIGSCQTGTSLSHPMEAGIGNDKLIYNSGELSLVYSDGKGNCHGKFNRSTIIQFVCDHSITGVNGPRFVEETSDCTYMFEWSTEHACPPHQVIDCTYEHGNDVFDLSRLSLPNNNYEMFYNASNKKYILNICRTLVYKKDMTCAFGSAACEIDLSETDRKKRYHNMGAAESLSFSYENNMLTVKYSNGEMCSDGKTLRSTKILLSCDKNSDALGTPRSHFQSDGCTDGFFWTSSAACPLVKTDDGDASVKAGNCKVKNPQTGYEFDLSGLKESAGYKTLDREGHMFELNVCDPLTNKKDCPDGTGSCRTDILDGVKGINTGKANGDLKYRDGVLVLEYKDGDECKSGASHHATFINFVCSADPWKGKPVYVDKSEDCEYYFNWHTPLACEKQVECSVKTDKGTVLDFSPLVRRSGKYNVLSNVAEDNRVGGMVYLNLCRPLNPVFGTLCPPGSGTCLIRDKEKPLSLGHVHDGMVYDSDTKEVKLTYVHGDPCPSKPSVNMSSLVILKCHTGHGLEPELDSVTSDCQYVFVWLTPFACENSGVTDFSSTCKYYDKITGVTTDLSRLSEKQTVKGENGRVFSLKPCGHLQDKGEKGEASCREASVCVEGAGDKSGSLGRFDKATVSKSDYTLDVKYTEGRSCKQAGITVKASSTIMFKCDRTAGLGKPVLMAASDCTSEFVWETSLVCLQERKECTLGNAGEMFDFNFLSQDSGAWNHTDSKKNVYWLNLCQPLHGPTVNARCPKNAAICMKSKDGTVSMLGDIDTQVMKVESHSEDSTSILVQYSQGDKSVCSTGRRRRRDLQPTVSIHLKCAETLGAPVLKENKIDSGKCIFEFEWNTRIACQVGKKPKEVQVKDGKIVDFRSGSVVDISPLLQESLHPAFDLNGKHYSVNLLGQLPLKKDEVDSKVCGGAVVCQTSTKTHKYRNLGSFEHRKYLLKDERLEVVLTSPEKCTGKHKDCNITSTIVFNCVNGTNQDNVELLYHTADCSYVFNWDTDRVCFHSATSSSSSSGKSAGGTNTPTAKDKNGGGDSGGFKIIIGIATVLIIITICVSILILHRPERRALIRMKLKSCIPCRKSSASPFLYSKWDNPDPEPVNPSSKDDEWNKKEKTLSGADDAELTIDNDPFNPFNEPDDEAEINNGQVPVQVHAFHDDSDEELLL